VYVGPFARFTRTVQSRGGRAIRLGHVWGQDFRNPLELDLCLLLVFLLTPALVVMAFPCTAWCSWSRINALKSDVVARRREGARLQLTHVAAMAQLQMPRAFVAENPLNSLAWSQPELAVLRRSPFKWVRCDQCCLGLKGPNGIAMKKPTAFYTNSDELVRTLARACRGDHPHEVCQGTATRPAENYPWPLAAVLADAVRPAREQEPTLDDRLFAPGCPNVDGYTYWLDAASLKIHRQA
jgi:hypothetical protein